MTGTEFIRRLSKATRYKPDVISRVLNAIPAVLLEGLSTDGQVSMPGVAKLKHVARKARMGHLPATGEKKFLPATVSISASIAPKLQTLYKEMMLGKD